MKPRRRMPLLVALGPMIRGLHSTNADGWCWCQPRIEPVLPFGEIVVHRHFFDRPEYGEEPS